MGVEQEQCCSAIVGGGIRAYVGGIAGNDRSQYGFSIDGDAAEKLIGARGGRHGADGAGIRAGGIRGPIGEDVVRSEILPAVER